MSRNFQNFTYFSVGVSPPFLPHPPPSISSILLVSYLPIFYYPYRYLLGVYLFLKLKFNRIMYKTYLRTLEDLTDLEESMRA